MPNLPASLSLTNIADGALAVAADERNNFASIQTGFNSLLTAMAITAKGDLLVATASGAISNVAVGANGTLLMADSTQANGVKWTTLTPGQEFGYDQITSPVNVVSTTEATGTTVISCAAHSFDGTPVLAHFWCPYANVAQVAGAAMIVCLFEGATQIGRLMGLTTPSATSPNQFPGPVGELRFTPTAGSHTYTVTAFEASGTAAIGAGASGTAAYAPAFIRFTKV